MYAVQWFDVWQIHETVTKHLTLLLSDQSFSMNDLNDPPRWNIRPEPAGNDGGRWNYALLVPMIGLAAFRKGSLHTFQSHSSSQMS